MYRHALRAGAVALAVLAAGPALAAPTVDASATADADYGAAKSSVRYDATATDGNFGTPTGASNASAYTISLTSDADFVYGLLVSDRNTGTAFANL